MTVTVIAFRWPICLITMILTSGIIRTVTDRIVKIYLDFHTLLKIIFTTILADALAASFILAASVLIAPDDRDAIRVAAIIGQITAFIVVYLVTAAIYGRMIIYPSTRRPIGFKKGALIALIVLPFQAIISAVAILLGIGIESALTF